MKENRKIIFDDLVKSIQDRQTAFKIIKSMSIFKPVKLFLLKKIDKDILFGQGLLSDYINDSYCLWKDPRSSELTVDYMNYYDTECKRYYTWQKPMPDDFKGEYNQDFIFCPNCGKEIKYEENI